MTALDGMEPIFICRSYASGHPFRGGLPSSLENLKRDQAGPRRAEDLPHRAYRPARLHRGRLSLVRREDGNENIKRHDDRHEQHQAAASHESLA